MPERLPPRPRTPAAVWWALILVSAVHLVTTAGTWIVTDQAEALFTARRLITDRTLDLAPASDAHVPALPWLQAEPGQPLRTRLLPGTAVALVPLLLLDRLLGWEDAVNYGRLVHLQGHVFVLAGLALLGGAVWRAYGSASAAAAVVALTGTAWPVWQVSKRGGAAPILFFLMCVFAAAGHAAPDRAPSRRAEIVRAACCALLPWVNPAGTVLSAALVIATWLEGRRVLPLFAGAVLGNASLVLLWNQLYHGHWWLGGYGSAHLGHEDWFGSVSFLQGLLRHVRAFLRQAPWLVLPALWFALRGGPEGRRRLILPATITAALLAVFATFYAPEPARRLSVVCPLWAMAVGWGWSRARWRHPWPLVALAGAGLLGFSWFMLDEGRYYAGPGGLFYPSVLWVKLALDGAPLWKTVLPVALLFAIATVSAQKVAAALRPAP